MTFSAEDRQAVIHVIQSHATSLARLSDDVTGIKATAIVFDLNAQTVL
jgi:hypothetical protein